MKKILGLCAALALAIIGCTATQEKSFIHPAATPGHQKTWNTAFGGADKSYDTELLKLREEIAPKFRTLKFEDPLTGRTMAYNLFIPKGYTPDKKYPLVLFMADAGTTGKGPQAPLKQGYGAIIWATDKSQSKHPCFVLIPAYEGPENVTSDHWQVSDEVDTTLHLLNHVKSKYSIDKNRLYATGQSMGAMISFYLNATHPDLFAASIFVAGQWDIKVLGPLAKMKFFYIVSAADPKASVGMNELGDMLKNKGVQFGTTQFAANLPQARQETEVRHLIENGHGINFIRFTAGTVAPKSVTGDARFVEHMYSFDPAYKLKSVRDWLFCQVKGDDSWKLYEKARATRDAKTAFAYYFQAAKLGHTLARYAVGRAYEKGEGVQKNIDKAILWFKKAGAKGNDSAMLDLGILYFRGNEVAQDYEKALDCFKLAWEYGHMKAPRYIGIIYEEGLGVQTNYAQALTFYKTASDAGDITAAARIGSLYERGLGVAQSYETAIKWYLKAAPTPQEAARNIHPRVLALSRLGYLYEKGLGVGQDTAKALAWYKVAAEDGDTFAESAVKRLSQNNKN